MHIVIIITLLILGAKAFGLKKFSYIVAGLVSFFLLSKVIPLIFAVLTSMVLAAIPYFSSILRFFSWIAIIIPAYGRVNIFRQHKNSSMTIEEAYSILGADESCTGEEIKRYYKAKMKVSHPDLGGSEEYAKKLTQARDLLLKMRREKK